jgi:hypothetical protein
VTRTLVAACWIGFGAHSEGLQDDETSSWAPFLVWQQFEDNLVRRNKFHCVVLLLLKLQLRIRRKN